MCQKAHFSTTSNPSSYSKVDILQSGGANINVDDYEVFQVVKM
jgi:hypothetical protein